MATCSEARAEKNPPHPIMPYRETNERGMPVAWGMFGWEGAMADRAISNDSLQAFKWLLEKGVINKDTKTLLNTTLLDLCKERAPKCAAYLQSQ